MFVFFGMYLGLMVGLLEVIERVLLGCASVCVVSNWPKLRSIVRSFEDI